MREYLNEWIEYGEFSNFGHQSERCRCPYRIVKVRKHISVEKGQQLLLNYVEYFYYITNIIDRSPQEVVELARKRCNHENRIAQLKSGIPALRMPCADFHANWAYMILAMIAWNLKPWLGLMMTDRFAREELIRMEFKRFLNHVIHIPCQIVRTSRRRIYRYVAYNSWIQRMLSVFHRISRLKLVFE